MKKVLLVVVLAFVCALGLTVPVLSLDGAVIPVYFEPSVDTVTLGQQFTINIVVGNVTTPAYNLTSGEISFEFNPAVVHVLSVTKGPYLASSGYSTFPMSPTIDNVNGSVKSAAESIAGGHVAPTGIGVIWAINFSAVAEGSSSINLTRAWLTEPPGMPENLLPVVITNGTVQVSAQGALSGLVTEGDGTTPIAGALVNLTQDSVLTASTSTNATGGYSLIDLPAGSYNLTVTKTYPERPTKNCAPNTTAVIVAGGTQTIQDVRLRHIADMYWDGEVNSFDLNILMAAWNTCEGDPGYNPVADLVPDGCINSFDLNVFSQEWNQVYY